MILLALDTSSDACSVALAHGDRVVHRHVVEPRAHTRVLIPMIEDVLGDAGASIADLDAIVLGNGPGSFIGMRIGASVAQGIAFGAGLRIAPVSSLAAVAAEVLRSSDADTVVVAQDARMDEVYLASFRRAESDLPECLEDVRLHSIDQPISELGRGTAVAGGAWRRHPRLLEGSGRSTDDVAVLYPDARFLLGIGARAWDAGLALAPEEVSPQYVRMTVAARPDVTVKRRGDKT